jgi:alpha-L-fucosidase
MTLGGAWGFVPNDQYKSAGEVVHKLVEIVAKGGSLLLGIGPKPDGTLPDEVTQKLSEIGKWTSKNGHAIYNTRITKNYHDGQTWFTQSKDGKKRFAIYCIHADEAIPDVIKWRNNIPKKGTDVLLLSTGKKVKWQNVGGEIILSLPKLEKTAALAFEFIPQ